MITKLYALNNIPVFDPEYFPDGNIGFINYLCRRKNIRACFIY